jgi:DNA polymerase III delta prime subunit
MLPTLFSRYAPKMLDDFGENGELVRSLLPMNLLLVGGPGVGKSSMCTTIVKEYFKGDPPYAAKANFFYINSLKDQGTAFYRTDVKCFCQTNSTIPGKKKIIIFDDLDNVIESGQQVFLSVIDNFGKNVIFLATCRSSSKIIDNIHSRMIVVRLAPFRKEFLAGLAGRVAVGEGLGLGPGAVDALVASCNHSVRTLLSLLERFAVVGEDITAESVRKHCRSCDMGRFVEALREGDFRASVALADTMCRAGHSPTDLMDAFFAELKADDAGLSEEEKYRAVKVVGKYINVLYSVQEHPVELVFFVSELLVQWQKERSC